MGALRPDRARPRAWSARSPGCTIWSGCCRPSPSCVEAGLTRRRLLLGARARRTCCCAAAWCGCGSTTRPASTASSAATSTCGSPSACCSRLPVGQTRVNRPPDAAPAATAPAPRHGRPRDRSRRRPPVGAVGDHHGRGRGAAGPACGTARERHQRTHRLDTPGGLEAPVEQRARLLVDGEPAARLRVHHRDDQGAPAPARGGDQGVARLAGVAVLDADEPPVALDPVGAGQQPVGVLDAVRPAARPGTCAVAVAQYRAKSALRSPARPKTARSYADDTWPGAS